MKKTDNNDLLFNLPLFSKQKSELLNLIQAQLIPERGVAPSLLTIFTPNPEQIVQAHQQPLFAKALGFGGILLPDGAGLVAASRILARFGKAQPLPQRISGIEVVESVLAMLRQTPLKGLIIGGRYLEAYAQSLRDAGSDIAWLEAYQNAKSPTKQEEQTVRDTLTRLKPSVVFVALGAPEQELWVANHQSQLESAGVRIAMVVGGSFDMLSGAVPRAPQWMQRSNLEWLFRLITQPWRWRRQLRLIQFMGIVLRELVKPTKRQ